MPMRSRVASRRRTGQPRDPTLRPLSTPFEGQLANFRVKTWPIALVFQLAARVICAVI